MNEHPPAPERAYPPPPARWFARAISGVGVLILVAPITACSADGNPQANASDRTTTTDRPTTTERSTITDAPTTTTTAPTTTTTAAPSTTTAPPPPTTTTAPPPAPPECHPSYDPCVPMASDVDCLGGSGNGPEYVGTVSVIGFDEYDLDRDADGVGCE